MNESDRAMLHALAEQVIADRLARGVVVGHTSKGRVIMEFPGEQTEAEQMWFGLAAKAPGSRREL